MTKKKSVVVEEQSKPKAALEKIEVSFKQVGKNLNIVLGEEKITRTGDKEELTPIKEAIKLYDSKPTKSNLQALQKLLKPVTVAKEKEVETTKAEVKLNKKKVKEEAKGIKTKPTKSSIEKVTVSKEESKKVEEKLKEEKQKPVPQAAVSSYRRSGEH